MKIFLHGMYEFRSDFTSHFDDMELYDRGREFAHKITFRLFDN